MSKKASAESIGGHLKDASTLTWGKMKDGWSHASGHVQEHGLMKSIGDAAKGHKLATAAGLTMVTLAGIGIARHHFRSKLADERSQQSRNRER